MNKMSKLSTLLGLVVLTPLVTTPVFAQSRVNQMTVGKLQVSQISSVKQSAHQLAVKMTVHNRGAQTVVLASPNFQLIINGKKYAAQNVATIQKNRAMGHFLLQTLKPQARLTGTIIFERPRHLPTSTKVRLEVSEGVWGTHQQVITL
ncbi:DUF4352 domain-containing protein [Lactiplantibacillus mudanjiangensis]|uniref:DUF4352 domain-containing protein n=1 Tax=Lactiplantibacillus mudanjiangensis TaxID=1296538 RepID=A0A660DZF9_9LACO|nr:DUF4352 domain-containing protein [Lactiplantibacillus mudanjiangensis]VDG22920.1 hypothetical protein MUDAN_IGPPGNFN_00457 [Lactiplantibacillus mudanjiangensis]VDG29220.1 hypothetical protein MUDAN_MDHGFNIF_00901 [Lactiplantibacillus mudanjiangensis]